MILTLFCLASIWANILCFNFAILCINSERNKTDSNSKEFYTNQQDLYLTTILAASALIANFIVVFYVSFLILILILFQINNYGIRVIFTLFGFLSGITTLIMPLTIEFGFYYVLGARVLQGNFKFVLFLAKLINYLSN